MRHGKFKQSNRVLGTGKGKLPIYVNNKQVMISKWKLNLLERVAILFTGTIWIKVDSRKGSHRPQAHHPFALKPYSRINKRGFTPHGEQL
jgi:hypothetical protein